MVGSGFKTPRYLLFALGIAVAVFGLRGGGFYIPLLGLRGEVKKPLPVWLGRLWFVGIGIVLIYLGIRY